MSKRKVSNTIHARNPNYNGPLCRYKIGCAEDAQKYGHPLRFRITKRKDNSNVDCQNCLYKLGLLPKREMPGTCRKAEVL